MILFAQWKFYLRNGDSFYAMEILFAQWVIYCTRKQKFFLRNDKASNLNHIHFAQWVKILCLWCLKSLLVLHHIICIMSEYKEISAPGFKSHWVQKNFFFFFWIRKIFFFFSISLSWLEFFIFACPQGILKD